MSLIPETIFHFEADGITERNNFVNLKKNIITFDCGTAMEKVVMLHRVQKLPCLRIRPLNQQEILEVKMSSSGMNVSLMNKAMIYDAAANAVSFAGFHMNKLTWKDAHLRLGCPNDDYLRKMAENNMVVGLKDLLPFPKEGVKKFCECMLGQSTEMTRMIPSVSGRVATLKGVSMDFGGPWPVESINGEVIWNLIKTHDERHMAIYFMKSKDEIEEVLDSYIIDMELHAEELGSVHANFELMATDRDSCYFSKTVKEWCRSRGIKQFSSAPYAHSFNSAEPMMRVVKEGTLNNLHLSGFPQHLWNYAMAQKVYTLNRSFTESCKKEEQKFVVPHLRMFENCLLYTSPSPRD